MTCGSSVPQARPTRRLLARCTSMKLRCRPPSLQNGLNALTTPAPLVQRLPTPPASETTATVPSARASIPASRSARSRLRGGVENILRLGVFDPAAGRKPVLRQPDPAVPQIGLDLFVLHAIESVSLEKRFETLRAPGVAILAARQKVVEQVLHRPRKFGALAAGGGKALQLGAARGRKQAGFGADERRHRQRVIFGRHQRRAAAQNPGVGSPLVDGEVVDHRVHGEGHRVFQFAFGLAHDDLETFLGERLAPRIEQESHPASRHAAEHPEPPEIRAEFGTCAADQRLGIEIPGPRDDGLHGTFEIALGAGSDGPDVAALQMAPRSRRGCPWLRDAPATPFRSGAGTSPSPFPGWGRHPAPFRREPAPGFAVTGRVWRG